VGQVLLVMGRVAGAGESRGCHCVFADDDSTETAVCNDAAEAPWQATPLSCCGVLFCVHRKKRVNQAYLVAMMEMGIPKHKAEVALTETGNVGVEVATEWLFSTPDTTQFEHYTSDTGEREGDPGGGGEGKMGQNVDEPKVFPVLQLSILQVHNRPSVATGAGSSWVGLLGKGRQAGLQ